LLNRAAALSGPGQVMLACFHPRHMYGDAAGEDAAVNFDKRAPYPVFNLLRAEQMEDYIDRGLADGILEKNKETLERLGSQRLLALYRDLIAPADEA
jgi:hypothetical protein